MRRFVAHTMGMPVSLALRGRHVDDELGRAAWSQVMADLCWTDEVFSTYRRDSFVSRLGRGEIELGDCPPEVAEVMHLGDVAERASEGAFSVRRPDVDPSGVVKGWAVQRAARHLRNLVETDFCLSAGGDMVCFAESEPWLVGIENPLEPTRLIAQVPVLDGAVATSGTARRGTHILDARTGRAPQGLASVTVIGPSLTWADIDATAAFALDQRCVAWLAGHGVGTALVVWADGATTRVVRGSDRRSTWQRCG